ncbi:tetratricopeptide repeat protein [Actinocrispum wychmicini]|uniref:Tetratricopeptide repeat protein n=1 Tax=Actinocrispum wychmicini TaxID=1213861 RepID=A0A4R2JLL8_9PSEU|nr:tetratricopeptide repeat protein [Actinocrispum wychmicini]TCO57948.1 tetratricopeptide repeat protein [Actinocrispum wychmicini]
MTTNAHGPAQVVGVPVAYGLETFRDRTREQNDVLRDLADAHTRVVTIVGRRGIGKSALAARVANSVQTVQRWRIVNVSSRTNGLSVERIYLDCARSVGGEAEQELLSVWTSGKTMVDKLMELLSVFAETPCLLVLDNLEDRLTDTGEPVDDELRDFLDVRFRVHHRLRALVTTQVPIALAPAMRRYESRLYLDDGLPSTDGVALLRELDRDGEAGLHRIPDEELARAVRRVHGVPRAIELVFGALVEDYLTLPTLDEVLVDYPAREDMVANLAQDRFRRLDYEARMVLDVLAVFGRPVPAAAVAWVVGPMAPDLDVTVTLAKLAARGRMVTVDRTTRTFALHPMDSDLIRSELDPDGPLGSRALDRRVADWYANSKLPAPRRHSVDDVLPDRYEFAHRVRAGDHEVAAQLLNEFDEFLMWRGSAAATAVMHEQLRGQLRDPEIKLGHLVGHGMSLVGIGPLDKAAEVLREAVELVDEVGDLHLTQRATFALGDAYRLLGRLDLAIEPLNRSVELAAQLRSPEWLSRALMSLSLAHSYRRELDLAQQVAERMHEHAETADYECGRAQAYDATALVALARGHWSEVIPATERASAAYRRAGVTEALGYVSNVQGLAFAALGEYDASEAALLRGRDYGNDLNSPRTVGLCLHNLAWLHWIRGDHRKAAETAQAALAAFGMSGGNDLIAAQALATAATAMSAGDLPEAARQLWSAAESSRGNADLVPAEWLELEAVRLAAEENSRE